jgi:hypothetical protein
MQELLTSVLIEQQQQHQQQQQQQQINYRTSMSSNVETGPLARRRVPPRRGNSTSSIDSALLHGTSLLDAWQPRGVGSGGGRRSADTGALSPPPVPPSANRWRVATLAPGPPGTRASQSSAALLPLQPPAAQVASQAAHAQVAASAPEAAAPAAAGQQFAAGEGLADAEGLHVVPFLRTPSRLNGQAVRSASGSHSGAFAGAWPGVPQLSLDVAAGSGYLPYLGGEGPACAGACSAWQPTPLLPPAALGWLCGRLGLGWCRGA